MSQLQYRPSETLQVLLNYVKGDLKRCTWRDAALVLGPLYYHDMKLVDVMSIVLKAYSEALAEPRFEIPAASSALEDLVFAPIKGSHAVEWPCPAKGIDTSYSIEQVYNSMLAYMLSNLRLARVDWLREVKDGQKNDKTLSVTAAAA